MHFLTRAQAFHPPLLGWFLRSLNMLPVYRVRDGFSSIQKNNEIFETCIRHLKRHDSVMIFAEASHNLKRRIRPLSKGFTRMAFNAEEEYDWQLGLQVVPVGINYSKHRESRNPVHLSFGEPIPVKEFEKFYKENPNAATQQLKEQVESGLKKLVMHVPDLESYSFHRIILDDLEKDRKKVVNPKLMNERINKLGAYATQENLDKAIILDRLLEKFEIRAEDIAYGKKWKFSDIILFPIYLFSLLNNLIPYQIVRFMTTKVIKDHTFDISIKFLIGILILPLYYGLVTLIMNFTGVQNPLLMFYFFISLLTSPFFIRAKYLFTPLSSAKLKKIKADTALKIERLVKEFLQIRKTVLNE